jgi:hypothetical protein
VPIIGASGANYRGFRANNRGYVLTQPHLPYVLAVVHTLQQGLTLVHFSAHMKQLLRDMLGRCRVSVIKMSQVELRSGRVDAPDTYPTFDLT